jgi:aminoacyl tRNA synthase complex-interacting multifunctional protein 1
MTGPVVSSAALGTLTVSQALLDKDLVLRLVVKIASPLQIKLVTSAKGADLSLELLNGSILKERNAVLRSLCGPALHHAVDLSTFILGGHSTSRTSAVSAMALSSLSSWMSVASNIRLSVTTKESVVEQLEPYLQERAFLIPSATATLGDMDVCSALMGMEAVTPNVQRWMEATHARMVELMGDTAIPPLSFASAPVPMPAFFYGTEGFMALGANAKSKPAAAAAAANTKPSPPSDSGAPVLTDEQKKAAADKRAKKAAEKPKKAAPPPPPVEAELTVAALDIRVGKIIKAWHHPESDKLFCEDVDVGEDAPRKIASGLRAFYQTEDLEGRLVLVLCNLKARNLAGFPSHGMVMCASNDDHTKVEFAVPPEGSVIGERIMFDSIVGEPEADTKVAKKKIFEKMAPDLKTDETGQVVWKTHKATTTAGAVMALNGMANAHVA